MAAEGRSPGRRRWRRNRIVRLVVPAAVVAALGTGAAVAARPDHSTTTADPSVATTGAAPSPAASRSTATAGSSPAAAPTTPTSAASASAAPASAVEGRDRDRTSRDHNRPDLSDHASDHGSDGRHRSEQLRPSPRSEPDPVVIGSRFTTVDLNVRRAPSTSSKVLTVLDPGSKVKITDTVRNGFRQVLYDQDAAWLSADYLSKKKPEPEEQSGGISTAPCQDGSAVESGLTPDAIRVHRAICARFPQVTGYGGVRSGDGGYHGTGQALDIMVSEPAGWEIARWVRANAAALGASEVIHAQHIWTVQRSSEGWRWMPDRGSSTANHYDHVHVSVYGNSGTA